MTTLLDQDRHARALLAVRASLALAWLAASLGLRPGIGAVPPNATAL